MAGVQERRVSEANKDSHDLELGLCENIHIDWLKSPRQCDPGALAGHAAKDLCSQYSIITLKPLSIDRQIRRSLTNIPLSQQVDGPRGATHSPLLFGRVWFGDPLAYSHPGHRRKKGK